MHQNAPLCNTKSLSADELLGLEMAARGAFSGYLHEWPLLKAALEKALGRELPVGMQAKEARELSQMCLEIQQ